MSAVPPTTEGRTLSKPQRVLACVLCQQRKVKCDRKYPCGNCIKSRVQCVPATKVSRPRKRRFPERELLERLRKYEDLLLQNNIRFEPLHKDSAGETEDPNVEGGCELDDERPETAKASGLSPSTTATSDTEYGAKNIRRAMSDSDSSDGDARVVEVRNALDQMFENNDHLFFGSRTTAVDISTLHPEPVHIFRLWQIYLENVDPLLKVTHTPSLQGRIIEAASNPAAIRPTLEALMFSIYCMAVLSIEVDDCQAMFGSSKADLLTKYHFGCQQALLNCGFLRCSERDCLTALYLYLISVESSTVPQSLSSMLGVAIRIAQRIGIHSEFTLTKCTALEAEMRRRLWWSLVLFDTRIGELADSKTTTLDATWDCKVPTNVNDSDLQAEMKESPQALGRSTEAIFAVVRSELGNSVRHYILHLNFPGLALRSFTNESQHASTLDASSRLANLEKTIDDKYLKFCDAENPLHFMTIWTTRASLAKCRLLESHSKYFRSSGPQAEAQRDAAVSYALRMLECDTKIMTSPLTKGFHWLVNCYFPFLAYLHVIQNLKRRPISDHAEQAWEVMGDNYETRFGSSRRDDSPFDIFAKNILLAWEIRVSAFKQLGKPLVTPRIVLSIRYKTSQPAQNSVSGNPGSAAETGFNDFSMSMPMDFGNHNLLYGIGLQDSFPETGLEGYTDLFGLPPLNADVDQLDWSAMDWNLVNTPAGDGGESTGLSLPY